MSVHEEFKSGNDSYVQSYGPELPIKPARKLIIVTCLDTRLDPVASLGIKVGDAHIIRNEGGTAKAAIRGIIISQHLAATREIALFHHTDCGMTKFSNEGIKAKLKEQFPAASSEVDGIDFLAFTSVEDSIKADVQYLKGHPLILKGTVITGWVYDVETGKVRQIV